MNKQWKLALSLTVAAACAGVVARGENEKKLPAYKKFHKVLVSKLVDGELDAVQKSLEDDLVKRPDDLETLYCLTALFAQRKNPEKALEYAKRAVAAGLPPERLIAGPRELLQPLTESAAFTEWIDGQVGELIHGPLLGAVTDTGAKVWVRTAKETEVEVQVAADETFAQVLKTAKCRTSAERDFTGIAVLEGLAPSTEYHYRLTLDGQPGPRSWRLRTFPAVGAPAQFEVVFGGGAGYTPWFERNWETIARHDPLALLMLGDNVYIDDPTHPAVQRYCYYRRQSRPEWRGLTAQTPVFAIWDDHDFVTNDQRGGPKIDEPEWKIPVWRLFQENWNNPAYGGGEQQPGCWFDFMIGQVHVIMLDGRYYREDPKGDHPSMLGPAQKQWLLETLRNSKGTFKVLCSPVPMSKGTKGGSPDTWDGYAEEREELFSFLADNKVDGVFVVCADRHRSDARKTERPGAYPLYEFESSRLTNVHTHGLVGDFIFGYNQKCSFGLLQFDTTVPDPTVTYRIFNIDDQEIWKMTVKRSELSFR